MFWWRASKKIVFFKFLFHQNKTEPLCTILIFALHVEIDVKFPKRVSFYWFTVVVRRLLRIVWRAVLVLNPGLEIRVRILVGPLRISISGKTICVLWPYGVRRCRSIFDSREKRLNYVTSVYSKTRGKNRCGNIVYTNFNTRFYLDFSLWRDI